MRAPAAEQDSLSPSPAAEDQRLRPSTYSRFKNNGLREELNPVHIFAITQTLRMSGKL